MIIVLNVYCDL